MEKKFNQSRVVPKPDQIHPVRRRARADFPKPPRPIVALAPKVGSRLGQYCFVEATKPSVRVMQA